MGQGRAFNMVFASTLVGWGGWGGGCRVILIHYGIYIVMVLILFISCYPSF